MDGVKFPFNCLQLIAVEVQINLIQFVYRDFWNKGKKYEQSPWSYEKSPSKKQLDKLNGEKAKNCRALLICMKFPQIIVSRNYRMGTMQKRF